MQEIFFITIIAIIAMVFGYTFNLDKRTLKLEKKNGHEQSQIDQLRKELNQTKQELAEQKEVNLKLVAKVQQLEDTLQKHQAKPKEIEY